METTEQLETMSLRELEQRIARCLPGSIGHALILPVLEAKRRRADSRRNWIFFIVGTLIAVAGIVAKYSK